MRLKVGVDIFCRAETGTEKGFSKKSTDDKIAVSGFENRLTCFCFRSLRILLIAIVQSYSRPLIGKTER